MPARGRVVQLVATAGLFAALGMLAAPNRAGADCAGPSISADPLSVGVGEVIEIRGRGFTTECKDTPMTPLGKPETGVEIRLVQGTVAVPVARVDASERYEFVVRVTVPSRLEPGPARVEASRSEGAVPPETVTIAVSVPSAAKAPRAGAAATDEIESASQGDDAPTWFAATIAAAAGATFVLLRRRRRAALSRG